MQAIAQTQDAGFARRELIQDLANLLGKILRIDVDKGKRYGIPKSNPYVEKKPKKNK